MTCSNRIAYIITCLITNYSKRVQTYYYSLSITCNGGGGINSFDIFIRLGYDVTEMRSRGRSGERRRILVSSVLMIEHAIKN